MNDSNSNMPPEMANVSLPSSITVSTFTAARLKEIEVMRKCIKESAGSKMAFQKLPKHMRRRAMSHVVKRLPRRLREIHLNQMTKSGLPPKSKRPTRRYRRRPLNLLSDYSRRQRRIKWLDTHIWHAKRFHMIEKWGYKLPKHPCDKSFRACFRATTQHCLVQDLSYKRCIEIMGSYEEILLQLAKITDSTTGLTFGAKCYSEGRKFGDLTVFEPNNSSCGFRRAIGEIQFFWDYKESEKNRVLWLFVHPGYYKQVLELLVKLYELNLTNLDGDKKATFYCGSQGIVLKELEYELGNFRLTGPLSTAVLKNSLKLANLEHEIPDCFSNYARPILSEQNEAFKNLTDTSFIPPSMVLSVIVDDPRLNLPKKRTKALLDITPNCKEFERYQKNLSLSPIFNDCVRHFVKDNKVSNAKICEMRSKCLIPGSELPLISQSIIPVILLWRTGNKTNVNNGYSSGWDVIVPSSWSQSFFISFVMWGARVGGLRETESIAFERSQADTLFPDTLAGEQEEKYVTDLYRDRFFKLPPNKRTNFSKFGIVSPFSFNWKMLITEWSGRNCDTFFVLRNRTLLKQVQEFITHKTGKSDMPFLPRNCLLPVKVTPVNKGVCSKFSIICALGAGDSNKEPVEPKYKDIFAQKRKKLRLEHRELLQRLRRRRKRAARAGKPVTPTDKNVLHRYMNEMKNLWLPEPKSIKTSCSRPIIGFIKHGGFAFTLGRSKGLGYVAADSLAALATSPHRNKVLVRNTNSRQYRFAELTVLVE